MYRTVPISPAVSVAPEGTLWRCRHDRGPRAGDPS